jgi:ubiquinone/menaquinone biosynthesis C-methylase UbiE
MDLSSIYARRFSPADGATQDRIWREITAHLQRHVPAGPVLDIGCDRGHFIRNVEAAERWAVDLREVGAELPGDVKFTRASGLELDKVLPTSYFGAVFMSNYLEHLDSAGAVIEQLRVARELARPGGRVIVLQPNIRLVGGAYWDFIDHKVALTDTSLVEAAGLAGLRTVSVTPRFLPYTTKSRLPQHPALVRAYLKCPPAWLLMGKQTLYVGERPR